MKSQSFDRRALPEGVVFGNWSGPDGWPHRMLDWPQPDGAPVRGSLLFLGGRGDFIEKYLEADGHWHGRGWNLASFDWRGQGASRGGIESGHLDSLDVLVEDLTAFVAQWRERSPEPHVVIGHSMGGHVLLRALAEGLVGLDAAVLIAPMIAINSGPLPGWVASTIARTLSRLGLSRVPAWKQDAQKPGFGSARQGRLTASRERYEDEIWWWQREPGYDIGAPSWGWLDHAYRSSAALTAERLDTIDTPILIVGTEGDRLVSPAAIRRAAGLLPNAELTMFEGAAHEILREADPVRLEAFTRIDAFLDVRAPAL